MTSKKIGKQSIRLTKAPAILASASIAGKKEGKGPLAHSFDYISEDTYFGEKSWEKAESAMLKRCFNLACDKAKTAPSTLDYMLSGDLLDQCTGSVYALRDIAVPFFGLYGACSTMAESLCLGAMLIDGGFATRVAAMTGSHFCSSERQFRYPLEYGVVRPPSAQWTVTGAGAIILAEEGSGPFITHLTTGVISDAGIKDARNMGAAMAPAAYNTLKCHFSDTGRDPDYYDAIFTGDLGSIGHSLVRALFAQDDIDLGERYEDCGMLIFDALAQDTHSGGSGCGCSASVLAGHILRKLQKGEWNRVLFAATGALMSPTSSLQGESIPGICHAVSIENVRG